MARISLPVGVKKHHQVSGPETFATLNDSATSIQHLYIEHARHLRWEHRLKVVDIQERLGQTRHWVITNTKKDAS